MVERGASGSSTLLPSTLVLTQSQIEALSDAFTPLGTAADCLRFVTEFFEVISQSPRHIYHSALVLAPQSSVVRKLYDRYIPPVLNAMSDIPISWDSRTASAGFTTGAIHGMWSPDGRFFAVDRADGVELRTTESVLSILNPPKSTPGMPVTPQSLIFSPDGDMLACTYRR